MKGASSTIKTLAISSTQLFLCEREKECMHI
jgi:hypothetical protein